MSESLKKINNVHNLLFLSFVILSFKYIYNCKRCLCSLSCKKIGNSLFYFLYKVCGFLQLDKNFSGNSGIPGFEIFNHGHREFREISFPGELFPYWLPY